MWLCTSCVFFIEHIAQEQSGTFIGDTYRLITNHQVPVPETDNQCIHRSTASGFYKWSIKSPYSVMPAVI
ncbi:hypothetical protein K239x_24610 [Planctomycetes bacterium K23_9]|uniref:Uncharacterized protein n=1 Tax=Stieleria marina TaxID=1930275 RepID=A0A517NTP9_9BACT|nr:hypothetical protein K239x_24610 [Planctomycetes bacterium K23_9]